jgi:hypothetical protein
MNLQVTVGPSGADFCGSDDLAIQAAIEYVAVHGGGTVQVAPGTYRLYNSVRLRSHVRLVGSGPETLLLKEPSTTVPIVEDTDWYETRVTVADASPFRVGGGVLLSGKSPHYGHEQIQIFTVVAIEGNSLWLDNLTSATGHPVHINNFWVGHEATASTLFSYVTGNWISDVEVSHLRVDGNRTANTYLHGNYAGALYFQDCRRVHLHHLQVENVDSDGLSFQVVDDLTIEDSVFTDAVQGIHAGSGSQRPLIRRNTIQRISSHGLVWCWGVKYGVAEDNVIEDCGSASSIGHRDTDNIMRRNVIRRCVTGLTYRDDPPHQAAHDNLIEENEFIDIGTPEAPGYAVNMDAPVKGNVLRRNRFVCTQPGLMTAAIRLGPKVQDVVIEENQVEGIAVEVEDLRA